MKTYSFLLLAAIGLVGPLAHADLAYQMKYIEAIWQSSDGKQVKIERQSADTVLLSGCRRDAKNDCTFIPRWIAYYNGSKDGFYVTQQGYRRTSFIQVSVDPNQLVSILNPNGEYGGPVGVVERHLRMGVAEAADDIDRSLCTGASGVEKAREIVKSHSDFLMALDGVSGTGVGIIRDRSVPNAEWCPSLEIHLTSADARPEIQATLGDSFLGLKVVYRVTEEATIH